MREAVIFVAGVLRRSDASRRFGPSRQEPDAHFLLGPGPTV